MNTLKYFYNLNVKLVLFISLITASFHINAEYFNQRIAFCSGATCPADIEISSCKESAHNFMPTCIERHGLCFFVKGEVFNDPTDPTLCTSYFYNVHRLRITGIDYGRNRGPCDQCIHEGDPVHVGTGNNFQTQVDYQSAAGGLLFTRYYNSTGGGRTDKFGGSWNATYFQEINFPQTNTALITRPDGKTYRFGNIGNIEWVSDSDVVERLQVILNGSIRIGWIYITEDDSVEEYDADGKLLSITNRAGQTQVLDYQVSSAEGGDDDPLTLDKVTGPFGRTLRFIYDSNGKVATLIDPDAQEYHYSYHSNSNIETVTYPDDTPGDNTDNPVRTYHYENVIDLPAHLTGITDETGKRIVTWVYDSWGRTVVSEIGGGAERIQFNYNSDISTTVTDDQSRSQTYHLVKHEGLFQVNQIDGGPCPNCGSQDKQTLFDNNGFVSWRQDFNNIWTSFTHDARGLETSRTEAVGTSEERTITTEWHPTFRLPTKITEPGKITNFIYDTQGRLLERKEEIGL